MCLHTLRCKVVGPDIFGRDPPGNEEGEDEEEAALEIFLGHK